MRKGTAQRPEMPRDNATAAECARLRDCLQTLSASAGKTTVRVELELSGKGEQILIKVTAPLETTEDAIGNMVLARMAECGFVRADGKKRKGKVRR